jgi:SAM-dependent methyltransferase
MHLRAKYLSSFALSYFYSKVDNFLSYLAAVRDSIILEPAEFSDAQFVRLCAYRTIKSQLLVENKSRMTRAIEFGGSNYFIKSILHGASYEIAPNFPEVDIQNLVDYPDNSYDIVVIDNILEHVAFPKKAVSEIFRILKDDGLCICLTPFLVKIHGYPNDYWRFTASGLRIVFDNFGDVKVWSWGNRFTITTTMRLGWLSVRNSKRLFKAALRNEPDWPITYLTIARKTGRSHLASSNSGGDQQPVAQDRA